ncbi:MAG: hypothetical protein MJK04_20010 [Psychrosphaera sp.]|nr:hypothetical protein [Psychrosphaera sp.]
MNINKSIFVLALTAASVFGSMSVQAGPIETEKAEKQQREKQEAKKQSEIEMLRLILGQETTQEKFCPTYPNC